MHEVSGLLCGSFMKARMMLPMQGLPDWMCAPAGTTAMKLLDSPVCTLSPPTGGVAGSMPPCSSSAGRSDWTTSSALSGSFGRPSAGQMSAYFSASGTWIRNCVTKRRIQWATCAWIRQGAGRSLHRPGKCANRNKRPARPQGSTAGEDSVSTFCAPLNSPRVVANARWRSVLRSAEQPCREPAGSTPGAIPGLTHCARRPHLRRRSLSVWLASWSGPARGSGYRVAYP